jgi:hypothetical protein
MTMRIFHVAVLCAFAGGLAACDDGTEGTPFEPEPTAAIRFVNAVPDTMAMDYRFTSAVLNAGMYDAAFRAVQENYVPFTAGSYTITVFLSSYDPAIAQQVVATVTDDFADAGRYTFVHSGALRSGAATATIMEDNATAPAAGKVALRVLHLGAGMGNLDVFVGTTTGSGTLPSGTASWTNVAFGGATGYVEFDAAALRVAATATATVTPLVADNTAAPAGSAATGVQSAIPGVQQVGSVLTVVILPASTPGSMAPQTAAYQVPAFRFLVDRRPD